MRNPSGFEFEMHPNHLFLILTNLTEISLSEFSISHPLNVYFNHSFEYCGHLKRLKNYLFFSLIYTIHSGLYGRSLFSGDIN